MQAVTQEGNVGIPTKEAGIRNSVGCCCCKKCKRHINNAKELNVCVVGELIWRCFAQHFMITYKEGMIWCASCMKYWYSKYDFWKFGSIQYDGMEDDKEEGEAEDWVLKYDIYDDSCLTTISTLHGIDKEEVDEWLYNNLMIGTRDISQQCIFHSEWTSRKCFTILCICCSNQCFKVFGLWADDGLSWKMIQISISAVVKLSLKMFVRELSADAVCGTNPYINEPNGSKEKEILEDTNNCCSNVYKYCKNVKRLLM